ncbi:uncharacterized protein F4812DRAFT_457565 [Daldinia caldariorum]|uniref:uncharacterized protein n=1 Tax=Daldinia caldariorum TaxID=326644 RepID=UPI002008451D|nr:uncharacterized protein F4812DRAFT_457565 [Daldinia caldariorum]KAI1470173.1 hypothetical protein F4812DRAFT_457565 [Daldinia caldariorum]
MSFDESLAIQLILLAIVLRQVLPYFYLLMIEPIPVVGEFSDPPANLVQHSEGGGDEFSKGKGKGKAVAENINGDSLSTGVLNTEITVDWTQYEPPEGLRDTADSKSDVVAQIIQESIDKVKARIAEEKKRRQEDGAKKLRETEKLLEEKEEIQGTEITGAPLDESPNEQNLAVQAPVPVSTMLGVADSSLIAPIQPVKPKKRSFRNLFRRLNNVGERGGSSTTGAARHKRDISRSSFEISGYTSKRGFVSGVLKKTVTNSSSSHTSSIHDAEVECVSCLDDFNPKDMVKAPCHSYCKRCFIRLIRTTCANEQQWPPKCCLNPIPSAVIILNVGNDLKKLYHERVAEWNLPISERVYCSSAGCSLWLRPDQINRDCDIARCSAGHWTCIICRGPQHDGTNCPEDRDMRMTDELAIEEGWKRCYGCQAYVEHREACQHMTCRCGAEFCYVCSARWRTCACTMEQLAAVKESAEARRLARQEKEAQEEAELQEALWLIAEFEREEELKAELLRQEQERLTEERRAKLLEERIRREGERRRAIEVKYLELREVFVKIHKLQHIAVQRNHSTEEARLESQDVTAWEGLQEKHKAKRENLSTVTRAKLTKREMILEREYVARVAEERRIEEQYHVQLKKYWSHKGDGDAKVEAAMKELKRKMDARFAQWEKWRDNELENYSWKVEEEQVIGEELMHEAARRLVEDMLEAQTAFLLRKTAELRWVDVLIEERSRMVNDMEVEEIENGESDDAWFEDGWLDQDEPDEMVSAEEFYECANS